MLLDAHVLYLHIQRIDLPNDQRSNICEKVDCILIRADNLGAGSKMPEDDEEIPRIYPFAYYAERNQFFANAFTYLYALCDMKQYITNPSVLEVFSHFQQLSTELMERFYPRKKIQQAGNCIVKNWNFGMQIRMRNFAIRLHNNAQRDHAKDALFRCFRKLEIRNLDLKRRHHSLYSASSQDLASAMNMKQFVLGEIEQKVKAGDSS